MIDAHVHSSQALLQSAADDEPARPYLEEYIWPLQGSYTPEDAEISMKLMITEMIKGGTTCYVDPLVHTRYDFDRLASTIETMGFRAVLAKLVMDQIGLARETGVIDRGMLETEEKSLKEAERAIERWNGAAEGRIRVWYGPRVARAPATACSPEFYTKIGVLAKERGVGITIHLAGEKDDLEYFQREYHKLPVEFMRDVGMLGPNVLLAMCCWVSDREMEILKETDTKVVHCPSANMKMASGICKVPQMLSRGITVALACDSSVNNNCLDMIAEMKAASLLANITNLNYKALTAEEALEMATINGARAIGQEDAIGSIEVGKKADIILVNMRKPHTTPNFDIIANLVYASVGSDVETVMINGKIVMEERSILVADEEAILSEAEERGRALLEKTGIRVASEWPLE